MLIRVVDFKGELPRRRSRLLPPGFAETAVNARLEDGSVAPMRLALLEKGLEQPAETIFLHGDVWRAWPGDVSAVQGPIADDRLYVTGDGVPKVIAGGQTYPLALPAPTARPSVQIQGEPDEGTTPERVVYAYTWRTVLLEESAPSRVSVRRQWSEGQTALLTGFGNPPVGRGVTHVRIYKSQTSALGVTDLYFVAEVALEDLGPPGNRQWVHDPVENPLQEVMGVADFDTPPNGMKGIISMPNGMMAAFTGREVLFCEPFLPHAWPQKYRLVVDHDVVGLASFGSVLAVLTKGAPYIAQGTSPESMVMEKVEGGLACLSRRGIVDLGYSAAYPSPDGLVMVSASGVQIVSRGLFTRDQWRALRPDTFRAAAFDGRYIFAHDDGNGPSLGVIDLTQEQPFYVRSDFPAQTLHHDIERGQLYLLEDGVKIRKWQTEGAQPKTYRWRSGEFYLPQPSVFGAILVEPDHAELCHGDRAVCRVFADGVLKAQIPVTGNPARLPGGRLHTRWQIEIEGTMPVMSVAMAQTMEELTT